MTSYFIKHNGFDKTILSGDKATNIHKWSEDEEVSLLHRAVDNKKSVAAVNDGMASTRQDDLTAIRLNALHARPHSLTVYVAVHLIDV